MISKDKSLFVVMDALNQVRRPHRTETSLPSSHDVTGRVTASFSYTESFIYISLLNFFNDDAIILQFLIIFKPFAFPWQQLSVNPILVRQILPRHFQ